MYLIHELHVYKYLRPQESSFLWENVREKSKDMGFAFDCQSRLVSRLVFKKCLLHQSFFLVCFEHFVTWASDLNLLTACSLSKSFQSAAMHFSATPEKRNPLKDHSNMEEQEQKQKVQDEEEQQQQQTEASVAAATTTNPQEPKPPNGAQVASSWFGFPLLLMPSYCFLCLGQCRACFQSSWNHMVVWLSFLFALPKSQDAVLVSSMVCIRFICFEQT